MLSPTGLYMNNQTHPRLRLTLLLLRPSEHCLQVQKIWEEPLRPEEHGLLPRLCLSGLFEGQPSRSLGAWKMFPVCICE